MQVLAGKYRRRRLQSAPTEKLRPTARRLRERLFDIVGPRIEGARFLDLCAGSGAVGIEALSRGAIQTTFVDRSPRVCNFIRANLELCRVPPEQIQVVADDAENFLLRHSHSKAPLWEIAFFDPPYASDYQPVIDVFAENKLLKSKGGVLVVEHHFETGLRASIGVLRRWRIIRQGESCLSFYERKK